MMKEILENWPPKDKMCNYKFVLSKDLDFEIPLEDSKSKGITKDNDVFR